MRKLPFLVLLAVPLLLPASPGNARQKAVQVPGAADFVFRASQSGLAEVQLGKLALAQAGRPEVKVFAQRMIEDHGQANAELLRLAVPKNLQPAEGIGPREMKLAGRLAQLRGDDFDREYVPGMIRDHEEAVALFEAAAGGLADPDLKAWAARTLPMLKAHLEMARRLGPAPAPAERLPPPEKDRRRPEPGSGSGKPEKCGPKKASVQGFSWIFLTGQRVAG
jgi:putative membrane protein